MRRLLQAFFLLCAASSLYAQNPKATIAVIEKYDKPFLQITNNQNSAIVAYDIYFTTMYPNGKTGAFSTSTDSFASEQRVGLISPGETMEREMRGPNATATFPERVPKKVVLVFEDGSTEGDATPIFTRWKRMDQDLGEVIDVLTVAQKQNTPLTQVANDLETRFSELKKEYQGKSSDYSRADFMVYRTLINSLRDASAPESQIYALTLPRLRRQKANLEAFLRKTGR